ncbi:MAG: hypothetical protein RSH52_26705 [Janthinobacterium sp.]
MAGAQLDDTLRQPGIPAKQAFPYPSPTKGGFMARTPTLAAALSPAAAALPPGKEHD